MQTFHKHSFSDIRDHSAVETIGNAQAPYTGTGQTIVNVLAATMKKKKKSRMT